MYTVQHKDFLSRVDKDGYIVNSRHPEHSIFDYSNTISALQWMESSYEERVGPVDKDLIWVWTRLNHANYMIPEDFFIYEFEVPMFDFKNNILWSDFYDWHIVLNQYDDYVYESIFNVNLKKPTTRLQGVTTRLKRDWFKKKFRFDDKV